MLTPTYLKSCMSAKCVERHALLITLLHHVTRFHGKYQVEDKTLLKCACQLVDKQVGVWCCGGELCQFMVWCQQRVFFCYLYPYILFTVHLNYAIILFNYML
jgi:hypothetical protein